MPRKCERPPPRLSTDGPATAADLSPTADAFIAAHLRSPEDLHILVRLIEQPERWWDAGLVAHELDVPVRAAQTALEWFASRNLLEVRLTTEIRYRLNPGTDSLRRAVHELHTAYRAEPVAVLRAISPDLQRIRDFAEAFRIKRDDR